MFEKLRTILENKKSGNVENELYEMALNNLGICCSHIKKRHEESKQLLEELLDLRKGPLRGANLAFSTFLQASGMRLAEMGFLECAAARFEEALQNRLGLRLAEKQYTAESHFHLAEVQLREEKTWQQAYQNYSMACKLQKRIFGINNEQVALSFIGMGLSGVKVKQFRVAHEALRQAQNIRAFNFGGDHPLAKEAETYFKTVPDMEIYEHE